MPLFPALAAALLLAAPPPPAPVATAADLAWLAGCWQAADGEPGSGEQWTAPAGGTLLGVARTVRGGRTVAHEFLQIRETEEKGLVYVALPSGQAETSFPLRRLAPHEAVFANPGHDFPQRISYRLETDGTLRARIEGTRNGAETAVDFPMWRVPCGAGQPPAGPSPAVPPTRVPTGPAAARPSG